MEESTLDAFAEDAVSEPEEEPSFGEDQSPADRGDATGGEAPPIAVTYRFSPEPRECVRCGGSGREHWAGDDGFVCPACVEW